MHARRAPSFVDPDVPVVEVGQTEYENEKDDADGAGVAKFARDERAVIHPQARGHPAAAWSPALAEEDQLQPVTLQRADHQQNEGKPHLRQNQRELDMPELAERPDAVEVRRLVDLLG